MSTRARETGRTGRPPLWRADLGHRPAIPLAGHLDRERVLRARNQPPGGILARISGVPSYANSYFTNASRRSFTTRCVPSSSGWALAKSFSRGSAFGCGRASTESPTFCSCTLDHAHRMTEEYWEGADLVMEVVSLGRRRPASGFEDEARGICAGWHPRILDRRPGTRPDHRFDA